MRCLIVSNFFVGFVAIVCCFEFTALNAEEKVNRTVISAFVDCQNNLNLAKGENQNCLSLNRLRIDHEHSLNKKMSARISLDPFAGGEENLNNLPIDMRESTHASSVLYPLTSYALQWVPRDNFSLSIEEYNGATKLPSTSGLALASTLDRTGWDQIAITASYHIPAFDGVNVEFALGNGEGENASNRDPQQYFAFKLAAVIKEAFELDFGVSFDGNNIGSSQKDWQDAYYSDIDNCDPIIDKNDNNFGYSTRRMAFGVKLNGKLASARGLMVGVGWQNITLSDLSKEKSFAPTVVELAGCRRLAEDELFLEDSSGEIANSMEHGVIAGHASYRILDTYVLGFDYQMRSVRSEHVKFFEPCNDFVGASCQGRGTLQNKIELTSLGYGLTIEVEDGLSLTMEYRLMEYDRRYNKFYFLKGDGDISPKLEVFNGRISYAWR
ncbi:MAG: hypothetical protein R3B45_17400 [Bdellovibrionota bacterium]